MTKRRTQGGAALLMAMMIVALIATAAASMIWQQWRAVQVESAERARAQAAWILNGALDWGRMILREDSRSRGADHLGEPWALPLAEARLSTFLAVDDANVDDAPDAFLSGHIVDAQSKYNLRRLHDGGKVNATEVLAFGRLLESIGLESALAGRIANGLRDAAGPAVGAQGDGPAPGGAAATASGAPTPLRPQSVDQLGWLGVDAESIRRMSPYVVLLPAPTPVNLNTASREVLMAAIDGLDAGSAERLIQARQRTPFSNINAAKALLPGGITLDPNRADTSSSYFELHGRLRLEDRILDEVWLVHRNGNNVIALQRQRASSREAAGVQ